MSKNMSYSTDGSTFFFCQLSTPTRHVFFADDDLGCQDLLIDLFVLQHLKFNTRTMLEYNRDSHQEIDLLWRITQRKDLGYLGRRMLCRSNCITEAMVARLQIIYKHLRHK